MARKSAKDRLQIRVLHSIGHWKGMTLGELQEDIKELITSLGPDVIFELDAYADWHDYDEYFVESDLHLTGYREENDQEYDKRQKKLIKSRESAKKSKALKKAREQEALEAKEKQDRELYEALKKKYDSQE